MEVFAHTMSYKETVLKEPVTIQCVPFEMKDFEEYTVVYNECFYDMRKALEIEPYDFLHSYEQIADKANSIYLLLDDHEIIGSVACYGNEIDDLIVSTERVR